MGDIIVLTNAVIGLPLRLSNTMVALVLATSSQKIDQLNGETLHLT